MISLTPSKIRDWYVCPKQYKLKHLDGMGAFGASSSPALSFGTSIHAALETLHSPRTAWGAPPDVEAVLKRHWRSDGYTDDREAKAYFTCGADALRRYLASEATPQGRVVGTEVYLTRVVTFGGTQVRLGCKADRVDARPDGRLEIIDYKTNLTGDVPSEETLAYDVANFVYYVLGRLSYPQYVDVVISQLNVHSLQKVEVVYDDERRAANKQALAGLVAAIDRDTFEPTPGSACAWCPVRGYCPMFGQEVDMDAF